MAIYFVGDIQGCFQELRSLLNQVEFDPETDQLWVAGDLVARGPDSLSVLRYIKSLGNSAKVVLGNHDLHLLAIHAGLKKAKSSDLLSELLGADDADELLNWLAQQPLVRKLPDENVYMSHAGLPPHWSPEKALEQATIASAYIASPERIQWLKVMYGEKPNQWSMAETNIEKFRFTVNALTRMRYCELDYSLEFSCKSTLDESPNHVKPWFTLTSMDKGYSWVFGHWAALMGVCPTKNIYALDTGCVWGGYLSLLRWSDKKLFIEHSHNKIVK
jgi:bis(5'-nucleosyl)-tetraphosphatase (symmetrical)